jgi:hypothetical protein
LQRFEFAHEVSKIEPLFQTGFSESNLATTAKIDPVFFKDIGGTIVISDDIADRHL